MKIPVLMHNGKYDIVFPLETSVKPMFDLLGTPDKDKKLMIYETDHFILKVEIFNFDNLLFFAYFQKQTTNA